MEQYHRPSEKKVSSGSGGRKRKFMDKRLASRGGVFASTKVAETDSREPVRRRGGNAGLKLKKAAVINVVSKDKMKKAKILRVLESHNPEFVRMNIITKGAVVETELGKVRITNRPGRDGIVNGILLS